MDFESVRQSLGAIRGWPWSEVKAVAELGLYYLTVLAVLGCLMRLGAIGRILRDFREARGPLWELKTTVNDLKELEPALRSLGKQVALVDEKVESARKQVAELQVESISTRSDTDSAEDADDVDQPGEPEAVAAIEDGENRNWLKLRDYWQRNRKRVEYVIDQIPDGRTKLAYDRLPRTNYRRILNKLEDQKLITEAAANASRDLNVLFNRFRPRNRTIPDEVVDSLQVLDEQLERELVHYSKVLAAENGDEPQPLQAPSPAIATGAVNRPANNRQSADQVFSGNPAT